MFRSLLISLFCIAQLSVGALAAFNGSRCGIEVPSHDERVKIEQAFNARKTALRKGQKVRDAEIPVYFHVVSEDDTREGGNLPDSMIEKQIQVMNEDFFYTGLSFYLADTTRTINAEWYRKVYHGNQQSKDMVSNLRIGGPDVLNVFTVGFTEPPPKKDPLLGYATFPWDYDSNPDVDGVVIDAETLPSGTNEDYNLGKTLTHEAGHWVGLWHTFQTDNNKPGCDRYGHGDYVDDTPLQKGATSGCPPESERPDTCPDDPGLDAIHNFMDYSDDVCLTEFTDGQVTRLREQIATYRGISA